MFTPQIIKLLNLTEDELSVINALENSNFTMSKLSKESNIARTTLYTTVATLKKRGLVESGKIKNKTMVNLVDKNKVDAILFMQSTQSKDNKHKGPLKNPDIKISYGTEKLFKIYTKISNLKKERLCVIQPTQSMLASIKKLTPDELANINNNIKKNKIIVDAIIHKNYMSRYMESILNQYGQVKNQEILLKSLKERTSEMNILDNQYLNTGSEVIFTNHELHILNWKDEIAVSIENEEIILLVKGLFDFAKNHSELVNYHKLIEAYLERIGK